MTEVLPKLPTPSYLAWDGNEGKFFSGFTADQMLDYARAALAAADAPSEPAFYGVINEEKQRVEICSDPSDQRFGGYPTAFYEAPQPAPSVPVAAESIAAHVAEVTGLTENFGRTQPEVFWADLSLPIGTKLYTAPQPAPAELSDDAAIGATLRRRVEREVAKTRPNKSVLRTLRFVLEAASKEKAS